ncbi:hypothetical protein IQ07DRAFT_646776 [Pyrenochaeta sp. DS3sAY3a]|nr:hypothetical protein IQ07DRAFT_646776 [Pyrenochaeta sp. DS3sAY3a]
MATSTATAHAALYKCAQKLLEENDLDACMYVASVNVLNIDTPWNFYIKNCVLLNDVYDKRGQAEHAQWREAAKEIWKENFFEADQKKDMQKLDELKKLSEELGLIGNEESRIPKREILMEQIMAANSKRKERRVQTDVDDAVGQGGEPGEASNTMAKGDEGIDHIPGLSINTSNERVTSEKTMDSMQNAFPEPRDNANSSENTFQPMFNLFSASENNATYSVAYLQAKRWVDKFNDGGAGHAHESSKSPGK